jgi:hypothetical protein
VAAAAVGRGGRRRVVPSPGTMLHVPKRPPCPPERVLLQSAELGELLQRGGAAAAAATTCPALQQQLRLRPRPEPSARRLASPPARVQLGRTGVSAPSNAGAEGAGAEGSRCPRRAAARDQAPTGSSTSRCTKAAASRGARNAALRRSTAEQELVPQLALEALEGAGGSEARTARQPTHDHQSVYYC